MPCKSPCRRYIHRAFTFSGGPSSIVWNELGPASPAFSTNECAWSVIMVMGSQSRVCVVALIVCYDAKAGGFLYVSLFFLTDRHRWRNKECSSCIHVCWMRSVETDWKWVKLIWLFFKLTIFVSRSSDDIFFSPVLGYISPPKKNVGQDLWSNFSN